MASTYLQRTFSTGNRKKWTWSAWVKRSKLGANIVLFSSWADTNNNSVIQFLDDDAFRYKDKAAGGTQANLYTNRKFRDTSSWYHIVVVYDSNNSTSGNRIRFYINGVEETSFSADTMPGQNNDSTVNRNCSHYIGTDDTTGYFFDGCMTHVHFCDGYAYSASDFGETDTTTGEWKAKTSPSVNYGTTGFLILKNGNTITDQSSNSNDFTLGAGTLTNLKDNPDNVFATLNALDNYYQADTLSNGNLTMTGGGQYAPRTATLGLTTGKWYWEIQTNNFQSSDGSAFGISSEVATAANYEYYNKSGGNTGYGYFSNGSGYGNGSTIFTGYGTASGTHIIGVALNLTDNKIAWSYDGAWQGSTNPTAGNTNMISITAPSSLNTGTYFPAFTQKDNSRVVNVNFGNGFFGTTAITTNSGNGYSGAEGSSKFNYTVPTGYSALSTKGLNE